MVKLRYMDLSTTNFKYSLISGFKSIEAVRANIIFGNPKNKCRGTGICGVYTTESISNLQTGCASAKAWIHAQNKETLCVQMAKNDLCKGCFQKHFGTGFLILTEDALIAFDLASKLKIEGKKLKSGKYRFVELNNSILVSIKIH